jgi:hypothetical protein
MPYWAAERDVLTCSAECIFPNGSRWLGKIVGDQYACDFGSLAAPKCENSKFAFTPIANNALGWMKFSFSAYLMLRPVVRWGLEKCDIIENSIRRGVMRSRFQNVLGSSVVSCLAGLPTCLTLIPGLPFYAILPSYLSLLVSGVQFSYDVFKVFCWSWKKCFPPSVRKQYEDNEKYVEKLNNKIKSFGEKYSPESDVKLEKLLKLERKQVPFKTELRITYLDMVGLLIKNKAQLKDKKLFLNVLKNAQLTAGEVEGMFRSWGSDLNISNENMESNNLTISDLIMNAPEGGNGVEMEENML